MSVARAYGPPAKTSGSHVMLGVSPFALFLTLASRFDLSVGNGPSATDVIGNSEH